VIAGFAGLATVVGTNLFRTGVGRAFVAIRDQDIAAEVVGVDPARYKLLAFAVSSAFVGLAGALTAYWTQILTWERFTLDVSILYLAMIIVGGLGSISGAVYGAAFMIALPAYLQQLSLRFQGDSFFVRNLPALQLLIFGATIILFLVFEPRGMARIWQRMKDYFRLWPFRY
jgi:branched-chain amino acid transport system permease protein